MSSSIFTGHVGMGYVRQDAEHEPPSKPTGSTPPWSCFSSRLRFLPFFLTLFLSQYQESKLEEHAHNLQTNKNVDGSSTAEYNSQEWLATGAHRASFQHLDITQAVAPSVNWEQHPSVYKEDHIIHLTQKQSTWSIKKPREINKECLKYFFCPC